MKGLSPEFESTIWEGFPTVINSQLYINYIKDNPLPSLYKYY